MTRRLAAILKDCERNGVNLAVRNGGLEARGSSSPALREELRRHKPNLLHYLRTGQCFHELPPETCAVCSGRVRTMIQEETKK